METKNIKNFNEKYICAEVKKDENNEKKIKNNFINIKEKNEGKKITEKKDNKVKNNNSELKRKKDKKVGLISKNKVDETNKRNTSNLQINTNKNRIVYKKLNVNPKSDNKINNINTVNTEPNNVLSSIETKFDLLLDEIRKSNKIHTKNRTKF